MSVLQKRGGKRHLRMTVTSLLLLAALASAAAPPQLLFYHTFAPLPGPIG